MLEEIKTPENAGSFLDNAIKNKSKIMGFGHREYKVKDPRAIILQKLAEELFIRFGADEMYEVAKSLEAEAIPRLGPKGIFPMTESHYLTFIFNRVIQKGSSIFRSFDLF